MRSRFGSVSDPSFRPRPARSVAGIRLKDASDEFARLSDRSNLVETTRLAAERTLLESAEEVRALRMINADLRRSVDSAKRRLPSGGDALAARLAELRTAVAAAAADVEALSAELADPRGASLQELGGDDPTSAEIEATTADVSQRLSRAREAALAHAARLDTLRERRAALERDVNGDTAAGAPSALAATRAMNETGARIRETTRRLMASVAELSLHEATAAALEADAAAKRTELAAAEAAAAEGGAPTAGADVAARSAIRMSAAGGAGAGAADATAPNARTHYVPAAEGGLGLPRPFDAFAAPVKGKK